MASSYKFICIYAEAAKAVPKSAGLESDEVA